MRKVSLQSLAAEPVSHDKTISKHVFLRKGDVPHLTNFSRAVLHPGQSVSEHCHDGMVEVFFVASGTGTMRINGANYPLAKGDCIVVEPGERHSLACGESGDMELLYLGVLSSD